MDMPPLHGQRESRRLLYSVCIGKREADGMSIRGVRQTVIDTRNGGQDCFQCRHYKATIRRRDPLFGEITDFQWCESKKAHVRPDEGLDCPMFLRPIFTANNHKKTH